LIRLITAKCDDKSGTVGGQAVTNQASIAPFSGVTIVDTNVNQTKALTVSLLAANGTLSNPSGVDSYSVVISDSIAASGSN
jgi:hypothetical protein